MITFKVNSLDPLFIIDKNKMITVLNDVCALLSLADGPFLKNESADNCYKVQKNNFSFSYNKESKFVKVIFEHKGMFLLKLKNTNSTTIEITLNINNPELEVKEIIHLLEPYKKVDKSPSRPTDG